MADESLPAHADECLVARYPVLPGEVFPWCTCWRDGFNAAVREHLDSLDGSPWSAVALLTGTPRDRLAEYEGDPHV